MLVTDKKYYNGGINLNTFAGSAYSSYLHGNIGDKIKAEITVSIEQAIKSDDINLLEVTATGSDYYFYMSTGTFVQKGFATGQTIKVKNAAGTDVLTAAITQLDDNQIWCTASSGSIATGTYADYTIYSTANLAGVVYTPNLIENEDTFATASLINGKNCEYYIQSMTLGGGAVAMLKKGISGPHQNGSCTVQYITNTNGVHVLKFVETFEISPVFIPDWSNNYDDGTTPDIYNSSKSLKHVFSIDARFDYNDPNSRIYFEYSSNKGSVGWFGEEFNGNNKKYSISSFAFTRVDTGASLNGLHISTKARCSVDISSSAASFGSNTVVGVHVLSAVEEYAESDYATTFLYEALQRKGAGSASGTRITNVTLAVTSTSLATVTFDVEYLSGDADLFDFKTIPFITWISLATYNVAVTSSDKCSLLICKRDYEYQNDISGLMTWDSVNIYEYPDASLALPKTGVKGWPKDSLVVDFEATILNTDGAKLDAFRVDTVAINSTTGQRFVIDSKPITLGTIPIDSDGKQYIDIDTTRSYNLPSGDHFNSVKLSTNTSATDMVLSGEIGLLVSWQDWIKNLEVDTVFLDVSKPNNNQNKKASNYSGLNNYDVYISLVASIQKDNSVTEYAQNIECELYDYGLDDSGTPKWSVSINTYDSLGNNTNGSIQTTGKTTVKAVYTPVTVSLLSKPSKVAKIWLEQSNQSDEYHFEIGSAKIDPTLTLLPPTGETFLKITTGASNVTLEAVIDGAKLPKGQTFNINSRFYYDGTPIPDYPYDLLAGSWALLSIYRRLKNGYAGYFIKIRRSSDNTSQSFGSVSGDYLDEAGIATFCSGTSGYIEQVYDQTGNGRHRIQTDWSRQPLIFTAGAVVKVNGKPAALFQDSTDNLQFGSGVFTSGTPYSIFAVYKRTNASSLLYTAGVNQYSYVGENGSGGSPHGQITVTKDYVNNALVSLTTKDACFDNLSQNTYLLHEMFGISPSGTWSNKLDFGGYGLWGYGFEWLGYYQEELIYSGNVEADRTVIKDNVNSIYSLW